MRKISNFIRKHGDKMFALVAGISVVTSQGCRTIWYEDEEPEGLRDFMKIKTNKTGK